MSNSQVQSKSGVSTDGGPTNIRTNGMDQQVVDQQTLKPRECVKNYVPHNITSKGTCQQMVGQLTL